MNFSERIEAVMRHYNLQAKAMAELCGVQRTAISHILSGRNRPSVGFIGQLSEAFPELNTRWLLHGKGAMFTSVTKQEIESTDVAKKESDIDLRHYSIADQESYHAVTNVKTNVTSERASKQETGDQLQANKRVVRIVFFYEDGTFSAYDPR